MSEAIQELAGYLLFEVPDHGMVTKEWYRWPPPVHLAVSRVKPPGRVPAIGVVDAISWATDRAFMPHATVVWLYDQLSISPTDPPPGWPGWAEPNPAPTTTLPVAYYVRRVQSYANIPLTHGGDQHDGARPEVRDGPEQPEGQPAADPG